MKYLLCSIFMLFISISLFSSEIKEVRNNKVLFSIEGLNKIEVGDSIEIFVGDSIIAQAKVSKIGRKSAIATIL